LACPSTHEKPGVKTRDAKMMDHLDILVYQINKKKRKFTILNSDGSSRYIWVWNRKNPILITFCRQLIIADAWWLIFDETPLPICWVSIAIWWCRQAHKDMPRRTCHDEHVIFVFVPLLLDPHPIMGTLWWISACSQNAYRSFPKTKQFFLTPLCYVKYTSFLASSFSQLLYIYLHICTYYVLHRS
jgi:hypothetical protein